MSASDCCTSTCCSSQIRSTLPVERVIQVLDNELRLRSISNPADCRHPTLHSSTRSIDRFDELTHFFNVINGLFRQSAFTLGVSTYHLAPLFRLSEMNVGVNMQIDQRSLEQDRIDWSNITLYTLIGRNEVTRELDKLAQRNSTTSMIKLHPTDRNFMVSVKHRWSPSWTTTVRLGTKAPKRLWSHVEYRHSSGTYELIGEYGPQAHATAIQFSCLSNLWRRTNCQIDGGVDLKITSKENLADLAVRVQRSVDSLVFKCDLYDPLARYLIGFQRCLSTHFTVGLLAEKAAGNQQQPMKFSLMSQWHLTKLGLRVNALLNTENELGVAMTHQLRHFPLLFQTFGLYSWRTHQCRVGIGLQILV